MVHRRFPDAQVGDTGRRLPGAARNPLIERARGELLLFLDDDVTVPPELLRRLVDTAARHPEASVFGGPDAPAEQLPFSGGAGCGAELAGRVRSGVPALGAATPVLCG